MNKKTILVICGFIIAIMLTATITVIIVRPKKENIHKETENIQNNSANKETNDTDESNSVIDESDTDKNASENINFDTPVMKDTIKEKEDNKKVENIKDENITNQENNKKSETDVITYVEDISKTSGNTLKNGFITVIDFLFYEGEIKGYTFSQLSNSAKLKIISLALKIDSKIDEYFPDYKEKISNATNKVYTGIKSKIITLYLDTTVKICSKNKDLCNDAKEGLADLKKNFGITWEFIKEITGTSLTKLKDWYEIWREE